MNKTFVVPAMLLAFSVVGVGREAQAQQLFQPPIQFFTDQQTQSLAVGDLNGDGLKDVALSSCACAPSTRGPHAEPNAGGVSGG